MVSGMGSISITQFFRDHHKLIRGLFRQAEAVDLRAHEMAAGVIRELLMMLEIHLKLEEEILYPFILDRASERGRALLAECLTDHRELASLVRAVRARPVDSEHFKPGLTSLIDSAEPHLEREEAEFFPLCETVLGEDLYGSLTERAISRKTEWMASPEYREAQPSVVQNPHGGEQMRKISA